MTPARDSIPERRSNPGAPQSHSSGVTPGLRGIRPRTNKRKRDSAPLEIPDKPDALQNSQKRSRSVE